MRQRDYLYEKKLSFLKKKQMIFIFWNKRELNLYIHIKIPDERKILQRRLRFYTIKETKKLWN